MIYEANYLRRQTMDALARDLLDNDQRSLMRTLRERVVAAAAIIEDGTVPATVLGAVAQPGRRVHRTSRREQLGLDTPEGALAFFQRHQPQDFQRLRAAVKLPPRPAYYRPDMDLSIVIDRGDVWYDLPFDEKGERMPAAAQEVPHLHPVREARAARSCRWSRGAPPSAAGAPSRPATATSTTATRARTWARG